MRKNPVRRTVMVAAILLGTFTVGACSLFLPKARPAEGASTTAAEPRAEPEVTTHAPGLNVEILDPDTGNRFAVTLGEVYVAASSRPCSKYYDAGTYGTGAKPRGVACRDGKGGWVRIPLHVRDGFAE